MRKPARQRQILHVDLDSFFVAVERSLNPTLRNRPVIIGGNGPSGIVAAASQEARAQGVAPGQPIARALRQCPHASFKPGDFEAYAHISAQVTAILLAHSRRVERPSVDEAFLELPTDRPARLAVTAVDHVRHEIQQRLNLDASFGLASSRLAARIASRWARPRGFLLLLPDHERSFLNRQSIAMLPDLLPRVERILVQHGLTTIGQVADADESLLVKLVGHATAAFLGSTARGQAEEPIMMATPPVEIHEEARPHEPDIDSAGLALLLDELVERACQKLHPFALAARSLAVEVLGALRPRRRTQDLALCVGDGPTLRRLVRNLAQPLLQPPQTVREIHLYLRELAPASPQYPLFPGLSGLARG